MDFAINQEASTLQHAITALFALQEHLILFHATMVIAVLETLTHGRHIAQVQLIPQHVPQDRLIQ
jgi:hypothetical protein